MRGRLPHLCQLSPSSLLRCWQSHVVTSALPRRLPTPVSRGGPEEQAQRPHLCAGHGVLGAGSATVPPSPRPFEDVSSAMPLPSSAKGSEAAGPMGKAGTLGDQMYLMVKGLVPRLAARASAWARGPAHDLAPARAPLTQSSQLCHLHGFFLKEKVFFSSAPSCNK